MSNFCTKCGAAVAAGSTFCPTCGAPVSATPIAAQTPAAPYVTPAAPAPPPPAYAQPVPAQAIPVAVQPTTSGGGGALKIILIVVGVFVLLGILGVAVVGFIGWRVSRAVHVDQSGALSIDTPNGTISAGANSSVSASNLGIDIYPGAKAGPGGLNLNTPRGSMVSAVYTTTDSASQVIDFYKSKLGDNVVTSESGNGTVITSTDNDSGSKVLITVTPQAGKTTIAIVHTTSKKS